MNAVSYAIHFNVPRQLGYVIGFNPSKLHEKDFLPGGV
jgi:hypothetical protein